jgi:hypothetical protein
VHRTVTVMARLGRYLAKREPRHVQHGMLLPFTQLLTVAAPHAGQAAQSAAGQQAAAEAERQEAKGDNSAASARVHTAQDCGC